MTEQGALERIHTFERFGSILGLERMKILMRLLGNPQDRLPVIHVAGTNGKGSVCRYIYQVLLEHGCQAGIYTSPFIESFHERMECGGIRITDAELERLTEKVLKKVERMVKDGQDSPTEFEVITAIAFLFFAERKAEFVVLEVGLGGRGDSTNIVKTPLLSVITSISLDHTDRLGETPAEIAAEKAGIIKANVPVISNVDDPKAARVIARTAYKKRAALLDAAKLKDTGLTAGLTGYTFHVKINGKRYSDIRISMPGRHQVRNAVCALAVIETLRSRGLLKTDGDAIRRGMRKAGQPGRFEVMGRKNPLIILDGAHNESGAKALADTMAELLPGRPVQVLLGVLSDKRLDAILFHLNRFAACYLATEPDNPRRLPAEDLCQAVRACGKPCRAVPDPARALQEALTQENGCEVVVVAGSLYLIGTIRRMLHETQQGAAVL